MTCPFVTFPSFRSLHKRPIIREAFPRHLHPIARTHCHSRTLSSASCVSVCTLYHNLTHTYYLLSVLVPMVSPEFRTVPAVGQGFDTFVLNDLLKNKIFSSTTRDWSERALMTNRGSTGNLWGDRYIGASKSQHSHLSFPSPTPIPRGCNRNICFLNLYPV